jgi:hypothetical protein
MSSAFFDYVRGRTEQPPAGYALRGLKVYRYLVLLGARQLLEASFPDLRQQLGEAAWLALTEDFVRQSQWDSHFYADLEDEFKNYLARAAA